MITDRSSLGTVHVRHVDRYSLCPAARSLRSVPRLPRRGARAPHSRGVAGPPLPAAVPRRVRARGARPGPRAAGPRGRGARRRTRHRRRLRRSRAARRLVRCVGRSAPVDVLVRGRYPWLPEVFALVDRRAESPMEARVRVVLVMAGMPPQVQYPVVVNGRSYRLDLACPAQRLAVEYDGEGHRLQAPARARSGRRTSSPRDGACCGSTRTWSCRAPTRSWRRCSPSLPRDPAADPPFGKCGRQIRGSGCQWSSRER